MVFRQPLQLGSIISFRYKGPNSHDPFPMVFVLSENHGGYLHGINLRYISPVQVMQLQWFFLTPFQRQQGGTDPFTVEQEMNKRKQELQQAYERKRQEMLQKQTGVIIAPQQGVKTFGMKTWSVTPKTLKQTPLIQDPKPHIYQPSTPNQFQPDQAAALDNILRNQVIMNQNQFETDPFNFYHLHIKQILGRPPPGMPNQGTVPANVALSYRKYRHDRIKTLRLVRSVPQTFAGRQFYGGPG